MSCDKALLDNACELRLRGLSGRDMRPWVRKTRGSLSLRMSAPSHTSSLHGGYCHRWNFGAMCHDPARQSSAWSQFAAGSMLTSLDQLDQLKGQQ
jgi:hypothetical protein